MQITIKDALAMENLGAKIAAELQGGEVIFLQGELGVGKTTFVRGLLHGLGHTAKVKSPTYTLIEPYSIAGKDIYHFDLYRINSEEELEGIGIRDYCDGAAICLFEWPEQGGELLPAADMVLSLMHSESGREVSIEANSSLGNAILKQL